MSDQDFSRGYRSDGDVNPPYKVSILKGLRTNVANLDIQLAETYKYWSYYIYNIAYKKISLTIKVILHQMNF